MARRRGRAQLLREFKKNKYGRTLKEVETLLALYGFIPRAAAKEASVWHRGRVSLTLPEPKTQFLLVDYVVLVIRKIEEAEAAGIPEEQAS